MSDIIDEEPEIEGGPDYAVSGKRVFVALTDIINCWILSYVLSLLFPSVYDHSVYIISLSLMMLYKVTAEMLGFQTFGKKMYKLEVLTRDLQKPGWSHVIRRNSLWILMIGMYSVFYYILIPSYNTLSELPYMYTLLNLSSALRLAVLIILIDMGFVFITPCRQALHDFLGDTVVVDRT